MMTPFGTYTVVSRRVGLAADSRIGLNAGTMASSSGSAMVAPNPRITVRRDTRFFVTIMVLSSHRTRRRQTSASGTARS